MRMHDPYLRQRHSKYILICCLLTLQIFAAAADTTCKRGCTQTDDGDLKYVPGTSYEYNFDSILTVALGSSSRGGGDNDDSNLKVQGTAKVFSEGNCGYTLQLNGVKVSTTKEAVEKKIQKSIQKPIHFTLVSGRLEPELCTDPTDNVYALNIKRALISLLQTTVEHSQTVEVDVFGKCPTQTSTSTVGNAKVITKIRSLNNCAYREHLDSGIINGITDDRAAVKSSLLLQADYSKETKLINGIVNNVEVVEQYRFAGAAKGAADVHAKVVTQLKLKNPSGVAAAAPASGNHAVNIIFQKPESHNVKNIAALKVALSELLQLESDFTKEGSAKQFVELIRLFRQADADSLLELSAVPQPNKVLARNVYLDALFRTGTAESAKAILKQLNKLEEKEKIIALLSLNLVQLVDKETLNLAATLLTPNAVKEVYLAIGSLVSKYCQRNTCEQSDIEQISKKLTDSLKHCKANTKKDEDRLVYILKGISNTHHLAKSVAASLAECASVGRSNRIRVAALQSFSASSCATPLQRKALDLLHDMNEDSELRIEAYLAAIDCPTAEVANEIADVLSKEQVQQVGGFIVSNLKAIRDSTDAKREQQRQYFAHIDVNKLFSKDFRRYSFNNEVSYKLEALGLSASSDFKLIYSQHGFLPRSARWNVSTEVFGTNFNVFETSVRQENMENVLEYYLGPKGLLNKDFEDILQLVNGGAAGAGGRARRSVADDASKFAKKYKSYGSKNVGDLNLDLSLKLFGSELLFLSLGDHIPSSLDDIVKDVSMAFEKVKTEAKSYSREFTTHSLFLDVELAYTTGLGIPLQLSAQGVSTNKLELGVNVDIDTLMSQNWQQAKYRLKLVPSVDVQVNAQFGFNAYVLSSGLLVSSELQSATGADVKLEFANEGNGFNVDIELPREKLELLNAKVNSNFYVAEQDKPQKLIALKSNKKADQPFETCYRQLDAVGLTICIASTARDANADNKNAVRTLSEELFRPLQLSIWVVAERNYKFKAYHKETDIKSHQWRLDFSTPGSKVTHDSAVVLELSTTQRIFGRLTFENPQYRFAVELGVKNDDKELLVYAQFEDNNDVRKNKVGFIRNGNEYKPIIQLQDKNGVANDINGYRADGKVLVQQTGDKQSKYTFQNFQLLNKNNERVVINGWAEVTPNSFNSELHVAPQQHSFLIKSNLKFADGEYSLGAFVNNEQTPDSIYGSSALVKIAEDNWHLEMIGKAFTWEMSGIHSLQLQKSKDSNTILSSKFSSEVLVKNKNQLEAAVKVSGLTESENKFEVDVAISRASKRGTLAVKLHRNQRAANDYLLEVNAKLNKNFIDILAKADISGNRIIVDNTLSTSWGTSVTAKGELGQRFTPQDIYVDLQGVLQLTTKDKPTQWLLKVVGAPEKTNSELKISRDNAELVKLTAETQHPQDKLTNGKAHLIVKNVLNTKVDFKIAKNGKGELNINVDTLKTEPKHKLEIATKFQIQAPKYDIDTIVTLDGSKKVSFKTENIVDKAKFSSKNIGEFENKKLMFEAAATIKGDWRLNGEILSSFIITLPDGHVVDGNFKRKTTTNVKTGNVQGNMELNLNDQLPAGGKKRSIVLSGKLDKLHMKTKEFIADNQIVFTNFDSQKLTINYSIKHLPKGQFKSLDLVLNVGGELAHLPIDLTIHVDEYSKNHANYQLSGKVGNKGTVNVNGKYNAATEDQAATYDVTLNLEAPSSSFKTLDFKSNGKLVRPATSSEANAAYVLEFNVDERLGSNQFIRFGSNVRSSRQQGSYNLNLQTNELKDALKIDGLYQIQQADKTDTASHKYAFNFNYVDKYVKLSTDLSHIGADSGTLHYKLDSNYESLKNIDVQLQAAKQPDESYSVQMQGKLDKDAYEVESKFYQTTSKKGLDVKVKLPTGKQVTVIGIFELLGERKAKWTLDLQHLIDLDLSSSIEAAYKDIDDFYVLAQWNSAKLQLPNYSFDARAQRKSINIHFKNAQGDILTGSASYALKKEKNKSIIEGQGQVQYKGKTQNANFKLIRQLYELQSDQEIGFSYTLNGNFGPKNAVATLKITTKDFNVKLSVCEERRQCTNVQIQSIIVTNTQNNIEPSQHSLLLLLDLRELGYPYEFELQSKTIRNGLKLQYNLDSNIKSQTNAYQLVVNVLPSSSMFMFKLPTRDIVFETKQQVPAQGSLFGHYAQSAAFYFDKSKHPNDVTRLAFKADLSGVDRVALNGNAELVFEHPKIRPLSINGKLAANREKLSIDSELNFDIFKTAEQQIVIKNNLQNLKSDRGYNITFNHLINSRGWHLRHSMNGHTALDLEKQEFSTGFDVNCGPLDVTASAFVFSSLERIEAEVTVMNRQLAQLKGQFNRQKYAGKLETKLQTLSNSPIEVITDFQPTTAKIHIKRGDLLDANAEIKLSKEIKFNVNGAGKALFNGRIALDAAHFLQTTYDSNEQDVKSWLNIVESELKQDTEQAKAQAQKHFQKLRDAFENNIKLAKDSAPDFSQLHSNYEQHLNAIIKEFENDADLKQLSETFQKVYIKLAQLEKDIAKIISEAYEKVHTSLSAVTEQVQLIIKDTILPVWEEATVVATKILGELRLEIINFCTEITQALLKLLEQYSPALKNYGKAITEALKPVHEATQEFLKKLAQTTGDIINDLLEAIGKLPTFEALQAELKQKLQELKLAEHALKILNAIFEQIQLVPLTPEEENLLKMCHEYLEAKIRQQPVDDEKAIGDLIQPFIAAVRSGWARWGVIFPAQSVALQEQGFGSLFNLAPFSSDALSQLPGLLTFRASVINFILNENWEQLFSKDYFKSWILFQDFELSAHLADGRNYITFDGHLISFAPAGSCKYILAQDSVDGNFTVIALVNNGKLKSIILTDRDGNSLEVTDATALKQNNQPVEYPLHAAGLHAWRKYYTVWLLSEYGVTVMCTTDLKVCHVNVNGFYTSKTRGLLGNGNAEPYDDNMLVDGTIAADDTALVNAYALGKCAAATVASIDAKKEQADVCKDLFGYESPLALGYLWLNAGPYRHACTETVNAANEKDKEAAACTIATAYASALRLKHQFVPLPQQCLKCAGAASQRELNQDFSVKIPNDKADVVFVVDLSVTHVLLEHLIQPTIKEIRDALTSRGLNDIQISVIVYNSTQLYPAILTSDNGKLNYNGDLANTVLSGPKRLCDNCISQIVSEKKLLDVYSAIEQFVNIIVPQSGEKAFRLALKYPFRAGAAKSIIAVRSEAVGYGNWLQVMRTHLADTISQFDAALFHLIAPVKDLSLEGVPTEKLVGFNSRLVATLDTKDAKKRQKLVFQNDLGIDYVLDNNGWVFDTNHFDNLRSPEQKKFLNQVTSSIADSLFKTEIVSDCKCVPISGLHAQHKCTIKTSNFVPNKKPKAAA